MQINAIQYGHEERENEHDAKNYSSPEAYRDSLFARCVAVLKNAETKRALSGSRERLSPINKTRYFCDQRDRDGKAAGWVIRADHHVL